MNAVDFGILWGDRCEPRLIARIVIAHSPYLAGFERGLLDFPKALLDCLNLLLYRWLTFPSNRGMPANRSAIKCIPVHNDNLWLNILAEFDKCSVGYCCWPGPIVGIGRDKGDARFYINLYSMRMGHSVPSRPSCRVWARDLPTNAALQPSTAFIDSAHLHSEMAGHPSRTHLFEHCNKVAVR